MSCFQIKSKKYNLENTSHTKMCVSRIFYEKDQIKIPLTFTAEQENSTLKIQTNDGSNSTLNLEYNLNNSGWTTYTQGNTITLENIGDTVQMRTAEAGNTTFNSNFSTYNQFIMTGRIAASGNVQSLIDQTMTRRDVSRYCYYGMFSGCTSLTQAPELPATTLADSCYSCMFLGCTSLTQAPELPATTLAYKCYYGMFSTCTSLTKAPALPATNLVNSCYDSMFYGCTNITSVTMKNAVKPYDQISYGKLDGKNGYTIIINYVD